MGMSDKKILHLLNGYEVKVQKLITYERFEGEVFKKLTHALEMIPKMRKFLEEGRKGKVFRWLGFLQCVFWMLDIYTVEQLANHSRPSKPDLQEQYPGHSFSEECSEAECCNFAGTYMEVKVPGRCLHQQEYLEASESAVPIT